MTYFTAIIRVVQIGGVKDAACVYAGVLVERAGEEVSMGVKVGVDGRVALILAQIDVQTQLTTVEKYHVVGYVTLNFIGQLIVPTPMKDCKKMRRVMMKVCKLPCLLDLPKV